MSYPIDLKIREHTHFISILIFYHILTNVSAKWNDTFAKYDSANLRRDYLSKYCQQGGQYAVAEQKEFENFLNCTIQGLVFPLDEDEIHETTAEAFYTKNRAVFENWCNSWPMQRKCEKNNEKYIDKCFTEYPSISVGFDLITAFFESACKKRGETLGALILYRYIARYRIYSPLNNLEYDILQCFKDTSLQFYQRNIKLILGCLRHQLRYCRDWYREIDEKCQATLKNILNEVEQSYRSSGYVYLITMDPSSNETFPLVDDYLKNECPSTKFAYIALFSLLAIILITLGLLVSVRTKFCNSLFSTNINQESLVNERISGGGSIEL